MVPESLEGAVKISVLAWLLQLTGKPMLSRSHWLSADSFGGESGQGTLVVRWFHPSIKL